MSTSLFLVIRRAPSSIDIAGVSQGKSKLQRLSSFFRLHLPSTLDWRPKETSLGKSCAKNVPSCRMTNFVVSEINPEGQVLLALSGVQVPTIVALSRLK